MKKIDYSVLDLVTDDEIQEICKNADLDLLLGPMKTHPEFYKKYTKRLGRIDKKSTVVQKFLPKYAFDLYKKDDQGYRDAISLIIKGLKENFAKSLEEEFKPPVHVYEVKEYSCDELVLLYEEISEKSANNISSEMFIIFLKLNDIVFASEIVNQLKEKIQESISERIVQEKYEKEKSEELKKKEKELTAHFEQEKNNLEKELKKQSRELAESKKETESLKCELENLLKREELEKDSIIAKWIREAEEKAKIKAKELDKELESYNITCRNEIDEACSELLNTRKFEIEEKLAELEQKAICRSEEIEKALAQLEKQKTNTMEILQELNEEEKRVRVKIDELTECEENFYSNMETRALEHKLNLILFEDENQYNTDSKKISTNMTEQLCYSIKKSFDNKMQKSEYVETIDDFAEDLKDNISLNFENSSEIAAIVISSILNQKAIIVEDCVGKILAESVSALIDGQPPVIVEANEISSKLLVSEINKLENRVIFIEGVLNSYNEIVFENLCRECNQKYLFFGIACIDSIKMFSKNVYYYALALDLEKYAQFPEEDSIFVGQHKIDKFKPIYDKKNCRSYYDKYFRGLVANSIMNQKACIDFSIMLQTYFQLIDNEQLGDVMKQTVLRCCDYELENEDESKKSVLMKAGVI